MAEYRIVDSVDFEAYIPGLAFVAADTILFGSNTECLYAGMTGAASLGLLHFSHGEMTAGSHIVDGVVADFTVIVIFF